MRTTTKRFSDLLHNKFQDQLQKKTNWGRNEIWNAFTTAEIEAFRELIDEIERSSLATPKSSEPIT